MLLINCQVIWYVVWCLSSTLQHCTWVGSGKVFNCLMNTTLAITAISWDITPVASFIKQLLSVTEPLNRNGPSITWRALMEWMRGWISTPLKPHWVQICFKSWVLPAKSLIFLVPNHNFAGWLPLVCFAVNSSAGGVKSTITVGCEIRIFCWFQNSLFFLMASSYRRWHFHSFVDVHSSLPNSHGPSTVTNLGRKFSNPFFFGRVYVTLW